MSLGSPKISVQLAKSRLEVTKTRAFAAHNLEHSEEPVLVRMGLHTGEFVQ